MLWRQVLHFRHMAALGVSFKVMLCICPCPGGAPSLGQAGLRGGLGFLPFEVLFPQNAISTCDFITPPCDACFYIRCVV